MSDSSIARIISDKSFSVNFQSAFAHLFPETNPPKVAVLATSEYEGIFKNGGIGTYYKNLGRMLAAEDWYVILLLCDFENGFAGQSHLAEIKHIFSTQEIEQVLALQPVHLSLLSSARQDWFDYLSFACLFYIQALCSAFKDSKIYIEFHEMIGFGCRILQAKQANLLGNNCQIGVTMHSGYEWLLEVNQIHFFNTVEEIWKVACHEQFSWENADLAFSPSRYLLEKVRSYGWQVQEALLMPNYIPIVNASESCKG